MQSHLDRLDEIATVQLGRRHVDGNTQLHWPFLRLLAHLSQCPLSKRVDNSDILGARDEYLRRDKSTLRMIPAHERFEA